MKTLIGLFGPPRAGKNSLINAINSLALIKSEKYWHPLSISREIKEYSHGIVKHVFDDSEKDVPQAILGGKTPRDLYIYIGQLDEFRNDLWAKPVADWIKDSPADRFVIESIGKQHQFEAILESKCCERIVLCEVMQGGLQYDSRGPIKDTRDIFRIYNPKVDNFDSGTLIGKAQELLTWVERQEPR